MKASIFEVLERGAIVFGDEEYGIVVTWNGSATFNWWVLQFESVQVWAEMDVKTVYGVETLRQAEMVAEDWLKEVEAEVEAGDED